MDTSDDPKEDILEVDDFAKRIGQADWDVVEAIFYRYTETVSDSITDSSIRFRREKRKSKQRKADYHLRKGWIKIIQRAPEDPEVAACSFYSRS